jgi:hypothetical protein
VRYLANAPSRHRGPRTTGTAFTRCPLDWFVQRGICAERLMSDNAAMDRIREVSGLTS